MLVTCVAKYREDSFFPHLHPYLLIILCCFCPDTLEIDPEYFFTRKSCYMKNIWIIKIKLENIVAQRTLLILLKIYCSKN